MGNLEEARERLERTIERSYGMNRDDENILISRLSKLTKTQLLRSCVFHIHRAESMVETIKKLTAESSRNKRYANKITRNLTWMLLIMGVMLSVISLLLLQTAGVSL